MIIKKKEVIQKKQNHTSKKKYYKTTKTNFIGQSKFKKKDLKKKGLT